MSPVNTAASKPCRSIWLFSFSSREQEKLVVREWMETARSPTVYSPVDRKCRLDDNIRASTTASF